MGTTSASAAMAEPSTSGAADSKAVTQASTSSNTNSTYPLQNRFYKLEPFEDAVFGAEVIGSDLNTQEFNKEFMDQVKTDLKQFRVLLWRGQGKIEGRGFKCQ